MKIAFYIFLICLIIITPIRIWEYRYIIDPVTGFYNSTNMSTFIMVAVLAFGTIIIVVAIEKGKILENPLQNGALGLGFSFILVGIVIEAIYLHYLLPQIRNIVHISTFDLILTIIGLATGLVFIIIGMKFVLKKTHDTFMRILMLVPILWSVSMMWRSFIGHQTIKAVSEHLFDIVSYILVTLGFLYLAYIVAGFGAIQHQKHMVLSGLLGSLLCLVNAISKMYNSIIQKTAQYSLMELGYVLDLSVGLLLMVACVYICFGVDNRKIKMDKFKIK